jgi:NitT/TauT family transport system substrate-binding protein
VAKTGGDPDKVTFLEVPFPQMIDAVRGGRVDAAFAIEPFLSAGVKAGAVHIVAWPYNATMKHIPIAQFVTTKKYIAAHPDIVVKFVRAFNKGVDWVNANTTSPDGIALFASYTRMKPAQIKSITVPPFTKTVDAAGVDGVVALMRANKLVDGKVDAKALIYKTAAEAVK